MAKLTKPSKLTTPSKLTKLMNIITAAAFLAVIYALFFINALKPPAEFSAAERRKLAQFPKLTAETVMSGKFMDGFDDYAVDQAAFREPFRRLKAEFDLSVLRKLDNNSIFVTEGNVFKIEYPINEPSILRLCGIINNICARYLQENKNVFYTIVPDKNAYLTGSGRLVIDYGKVVKLVRDAVPGGMPYIDLFGALSLDDYFRTDSHWKQERIGGAAEALARGMSAGYAPKPYTPFSMDQFYGVYYGQSALNIEPDVLTWLVNETTESASAAAVEKPGVEMPVYDLTQLDAVDPYSIFLCGPTALVTVRNPLNESGRGLIMIRDSYASALAPLLLEAYSTITLIDFRYVSPDQIGAFVDFSGQDVLFIYSAPLFNNSDSVRGFAETFASPFVARSRIAAP